MGTHKKLNPTWALAFVELQDAYTDFMMSRQSMLVTPRTMRFYKFTLGKILEFLQENNVHSPREIKSRHIRALLARLANSGYKDTYIHTYARVSKTFLKFLLQEKYIDEPVEFVMPKLSKRVLPYLKAEEVSYIISSCTDIRDIAFLLTMIDSGIRLEEVINLNWGDVNIPIGSVLIRKGKGNKFRTVVIGNRTRRELLKYKRTVDGSPDNPLFQKRRNKGGRFKTPGIRSWLIRISNKVGIHLSPHILRRTFATLSLKSGMDVFHLQKLLGHSTLEMTRRYVDMIDSDLLKAHKEHGPVDNLLK